MNRYSFSRAEMMGYLTAAPRYRVLGDQTSVVDFTVAVNDAFHRDGERIETVAYVDITCFGELGKTIKNLPKGSGVYCEGRLASETWDDKKSGKKRFRLKVVATRVCCITSPPAESKNQASQQAEAEAV